LPKGVRLTQAGELLAGYARRIFALREEAEAALEELRGVRRGSLTVAATTTIGVYLLPELFVKFRQAFPGIALHLEIANTNAICTRLIEGTADLGLTETRVDDAAFEPAAFLEDDLVAIAAPSHSLAGRRRIGAAALCLEPFVVRETGSDTKSLVERALAERGLAVTPIMSLGSTEAIKRAVAAGVGVAIVSRLAVSLEVAAGRLALLNVHDLRLRRPLYRLLVRGRHLSKATTAFTSLLDTEIAKAAGLNQ
jgi:DNA-binding transcriptional LysR family regulator